MMAAVAVRRMTRHPAAGENDGEKRVLFLCTANAARSQMAEGLLRARHGDRYDVFPDGTRQSEVRPRAILVMQEIGIDISHQQSKTISALDGASFDLAVTLCDTAYAVCPVVPGAKKPFIKDLPTRT
jgi:arsenate reductase